MHDLHYVPLLFITVENAYSFLNHKCTGPKLVHTWFPEIDFVRDMCVCVSATRLLITSGTMWHDIDPVSLVKQDLQVTYA